MYNFSGVLYRIWGVCGAILILGVVCVLFEKPWIKKDKAKKGKFLSTLNDKIGLIMITVAFCLGLIYLSRIVFPDISSYTGEFIVSHRNSRVAPPLPLTYEYVFWNGEGKRQVFYLDSFSKKEIFPYEFVSDQEYTIYFDEFTNVITRVEPVQ